MIVKDLKLAFRIISFGIDMKKSFIGAVIMLLVGIGLACTGDMTLGMYGVFLMTVSPILIFSAYMNANSIRVALASPQAKRLQTSVMATLLITLELVGFVFSVLTMLILAEVGRIDTEFVGVMSITLIGLILLCVIYYVFSYHFFTASTIGYFILFMVLTETEKYLNDWLMTLQIAWPIVFGIGLVCIILAWFPVRFLAERMMKYPVDPKALGAAGKELTS